MKRLIASLLILPLTLSAQVKRLGEDVCYNAELTGIASSGEYAPFWLTNNRYGLSTIHNNSGYLRASISRDVNASGIGKKGYWHFGYGADMAVPVGMDGHFVLQQLYADIQWRAMRLSIGQKQRPLELKKQALSSGAMTSGINARPLPQVRFGLPDFLTIPGTKGWIAIRGWMSYGWYTDNAWQRHFVKPGSKYTANSLYHSKAGFLRIGNKETFPVTLTGAFEMSTQFGGRAWNLQNRLDAGGGIYDEKIASGLKAYWDAFIPGGKDSNDGAYANVAGNQLGSYHLRADYHGKGWGIGLYMEHFFEDESQLFWQYGWKDMLIGVEVNLPKNRFVSTVVYEHNGTMDQSGPIYHDATQNLPHQISAQDEYYNNHIYGAWQHAGFTMGSPLLISPIYNKVENIYVHHNRIRANHVGISGNPTNALSWRALYTHERSLGTYISPVTDPQTGHFLLLEATYKIPKVNGLAVSLSYGMNEGDLLGSSHGGMLSVAYSGLLSKKKE